MQFRRTGRAAPLAKHAGDGSMSQRQRQTISRRLAGTPSYSGVLVPLKGRRFARTIVSLPFAASLTAGCAFANVGVLPPVVSPVPGGHGQSPRFMGGKSAAWQRRDTKKDATEDCATRLAGIRIVSSSADQTLDTAMASYGNSGKGWSGGDGGASVTVPGGRTVWLFNDSYLGKVVGGARTVSDFVHNVMVVQAGNRFTTLDKMHNGKPMEFMSRGLRPGHFYWSNDGIVSGKTLFVSYSSYYWLTQPSVLGMTYGGTVLAAFSLRNFHLEGLAPLTKTGGIKWGISMLDVGKYVYIYGSSSKGGRERGAIYVARAPKDDLLSAWQYFTGQTWVRRAASAARLQNTVAAGYTVSKLANVYVLTTMENSGLLSDHLIMYFACSPTGPFLDGRIVYTTLGHGGVYGTNGIPGVYTYGACMHPELTRGDTVVVSYDVNSADWAILNTDVNIVRPRYVRATISFGSAGAGQSSRASA